MSLLAPYASPGEYLVDTGNKEQADTLLLVQLTGMTRLLDEALHIATFNPHDGTYLFDSPGGSLLRLKDDAGLQHFLRAIDANGLRIDSDLDGAFDDYTLDTGDAGVQLWPANAAALERPATGVRLRAVSGAPLTRFPAGQGIVQIAGTWGFEVVPDIVKRLVIHRTHEMRQALPGGALEALPSFESEQVPMRPQTFWLWKEAERLVGSKLPGLA